MVFSSENLYLYRPKLVMTFLGVWIPEEDEALIRKLYRTLLLSLQYIFLLFQIIYIFQVWGDLDAVSQACYVLCTQANLCFKITMFLVHRRTQKELLKQMESNIFMPQSFSHQEILKVQATRIKRFLLAFMIGSQAICAMWALYPLFDETGSRKFPFDMWMPVRPEKSPHYHIGYAFQFLTISMSAYMYFGVDSVALSMMIFACGQIDIIKDKIISIETIWDKRGLGVAMKLEANYKKLTECIKQHQAVKLFIKQLEDANHMYLFFQLTGSVGLICMSALRILVVEVKSVQFVSIVTYITVMNSQMFMYCWCGNELTVANEELPTVLYQSMWYEQSLQFQKDLAIAMICMSRPLVLKAGHYIPLLRRTFVSIIRISYSYFAVLNQTM